MRKLIWMPLLVLLFPLVSSAGTMTLTVNGTNSLQADWSYTCSMQFYVTNGEGFCKTESNSCCRTFAYCIHRCDNCRKLYNQLLIIKGKDWPIFDTVNASPNHSKAYTVCHLNTTVTTQKNRIKAKAAQKEGPIMLRSF